MELGIELSTANGMDSREIARITGKQHNNVCRDIIAMFRQMEGGCSKLSDPPEDTAKVQLPAGLIPFAHTYVHEQTKLRHRCFILPKRECLILATGYDVVLRAKVIDRWAELEAAAGHMVPTTYPQALRQLAKVLEQREAAERAREIAERARDEAQTALVAAMPAVHAQEALTASIGSIGVREAAKRIGWPPKAFVNLLIAGDHLFREGGKLQIKRRPGAEERFVMHTGTTPILSGKHAGKEHEFGQVKFTPAGLAWFAAHTPKYVAPPKKPRKSRAKKAS